MKRYTIFVTIISALFILLNEDRSIAANIDKLISDLGNPNRQIRLSTVEQLGGIRDESSIDLLMNVANASYEDWRIRIRAIHLLGEIGNPRAIDVLAKIFNDPFVNTACPAIKWYTAIALGNFKKNPKVTDTLISGLEDDHLITREASIQSLGKNGDPKAVPILISSLRDNHFAIKVSAIKSLGQIGDRQAIPPLIDVADNDSDPYIKNEALSVLRNFSAQ